MQLTSDGAETTAIQMCRIASRGDGTVAFNINKESEKIKRNIGYMSQRFSLYEDLRYGRTYGSLVASMACRKR